MARSTRKTRTTKKAGTAKRAASHKTARRTPAARSTRKPAAKRAPKSVGGYADVNGLHMYYEVHGEGQPLVLLHGAFSAIGSSFGKMLPGLAARGRQVIGLELQGHGRTADIDRPLSIPQLADDTAAFITQRGQGSADVFGYSMGAAVALQVAIRHPEVVRKLVMMSVTTKRNGIHPGLMDGLGQMKPEMMYGSQWHEEYTRIAPHPEDFNKLFAKKTEMDRGTQDVPDEAVQLIQAPVLFIIGDSDLVRPEHAVEVFRLLGGGVFGDMAGLPKSRLAVLPATSHVGCAGYFVHPPELGHKQVVLHSQTTAQDDTAESSHNYVESAYPIRQAAVVLSVHRRQPILPSLHAARKLQPRYRHAR